MNIDRPKLSTCVLLSATLSSLFFYPLFSELHDSILDLQWRLINTIELMCVLLLFMFGGVFIFYLVYRLKNAYIKLLLLSMIIFVPAMSFFIYVLKQLLGVGRIIAICNSIFGQHKGISLVLMAILLIGYIFIMIRYPRRIVQAVILILFILSPVNISSIWCLIKTLPAESVIEIENYKDKMQGQNRNRPNNNILVLLFDELSYDYLYENGKIKQEFENFGNLSLSSDNYHRAVSPGSATLTAIPGLIMAKRYAGIKIKYDDIYEMTDMKKLKLLSVDSNNLFAYAKDAGYETFCFGPYLPYCELFGKWLDGARSFSVYNYGNLDKSFKLYNPIFTTMILWPHQFPYGLLKDRIYSLWQRDIIKKSYTLTTRAINRSDHFFVFVHFYIPHLPYIYDKDGYYNNRRPFLPSHENYFKQLLYADRILGNLIAELKANGKFDKTTIVLLSDHNFRVMFPGKSETIPFIIKHENQKKQSDNYDFIKTEEVLKKELFGRGF